MTDLEKATIALIMAYDELRRHSKEDALQLIEMAYQCDRLQATEFVDTIENIVFHAIHYPIDHKHFIELPIMDCNKLREQIAELKSQLSSMRRIIKNA